MNYYFLILQKNVYLFIHGEYHNLKIESIFFMCKKQTFQTNADFRKMPVSLVFVSN